MIISENLNKPLLSVKISFYLCSLVNFFFFYLCFFLEWQFLKCIFWGSNFEVHPWSEEAILKYTRVQKCIFWWRYYFNFLIHCCWLVWLLVILLTLNKSKNLIVVLLTLNKSQTSSAKSKFARISSKPC